LLVGAGGAAAMAQQRMIRPNIWTVLGGAAVGTTLALFAHSATAPKKDGKEATGSLSNVAKDVQTSIEKMG
jgi:hypothetical protein